MTDTPDHRWQQAQHDLLMKGDPTAPSIISERLYPTLKTYLEQKFPEVDQDLIVMALDDALIDYFKHPQKYDPSKKSLIGYLKMAARGDLLNALDSQQRRRRREVSYEVITLRSGGNDEDVELFDDTSELINENELLNQNNIKLHENERAEPEPSFVLESIFSNKTDQLLARLVIKKVRETECYSQVLGIRSLPINEQRTLVKKHKDRIKKRLERMKGAS